MNRQHTLNRDAAGEGTRRIDKLIVYFQELLDSTPDNPDPESDDAIERQQLHARIKSLESRKQGYELSVSTSIAARATEDDAKPALQRVDDVPPSSDVPLQPVSAAGEKTSTRIPGEKPKVRIVVIDDIAVIRRGLTALLESQSGWKVVAEADNGESAIEMVKQHKPDIVLMNISMPGRLDGIAATREITQDMPEMRVLVHTMHTSKQIVREILAAGGRGYLMQSDAPRDLIKAAETVLEGKLFFTQTLSETLLDGFLEKPQPMRAENLLTKRETDIVALLSHGKSNKEVATELNISLRTAETHRANIMNKLQLHSIQDLVRYAVKNKLVEL